MTYEEFSKRQKEILEECRPLVKDLRLDEFNAKMNELIELQDKYLEEQKNFQIALYASRVFLSWSLNLSEFKSLLM